MKKRKKNAGKALEKGRPFSRERMIVDAKSKAQVKTVIFGTVTVRDSAPPREEILANIKKGNSALKRAVFGFVEPGVSIKTKADIPSYFADPANPTLLIRRLNGKLERGQLKGGRFIRASE